MANQSNAVQNSEVAGFSWWHLVKAFYFLLDDKRGKYLAYTVVLALALFYDLVPTFLIGRIIDFFTNFHAGDSLNTFYKYVAIFTVTWGVVAMIRLSVKKRLAALQSNVAYFTRVKGFEKLLDFSVAWHEKENTGNKVQRIQNGTDTLKQLQALISNDLLGQIISVVGVLISFLIVKPTFFFYSLIYICIFMAVQLSFYRRMVEMNNQNNILMEKAGGTYYEGLNNLLTIKTLGVKDDFKKNVVSREAMTRDYSIKRVTMMNNKWKIFQIVNAVSIGGVLLLAGNNFIAQSISLGSIFVIYNYFQKLNGSVSKSTDSIEKLVNAKVSIARMMPIFWGDSQAKQGSLEFPKEWDKISILNATFSYPASVENNPEHKVGLKNLNLSFNKFEKIGVVGQSGSGKSTFAKILLGLYGFDSGIFTIGNTDFKDIKHNEVTKEMTLVLQDSEMFNLSIKENITLMREFDPVLFEKAVLVSQLKDVIEKLPNGLDTLIGEKGYKLSGGERQRIGIARAIYKNAQILILDEATSSLDSRTESFIQEALETALQKQTVISIAHRVSTLKNMDRIIVFSDGCLVEEGKYQDLSQNPHSKFNEIYKKQMNEAGDSGEVSIVRT